ncbi:fibro-slime domain-containing protein [Lentilactobacillus sp. Marseille-Q4993]|uniref:fibro-slime domain-containing protein n=1 Tax=Lentilactobacillus sp. Marseille-Q4993 TaxID=3039492 RepID=UPI0024BCC68A|nr:fibro-slime domain-containing protein [Lentilactobacillus sp. Marseille-Q4993]
MNNKSNRVPSRFKMYKKGKMWLFGCAFILTIGGASSVSASEVKSDQVNESAQAEIYSISKADSENAEVQTQTQTQNTEQIVESKKQVEDSVHTPSYVAKSESKPAKVQSDDDIDAAIESGVQKTRKVEYHQANSQTATNTNSEVKKAGTALSVQSPKSDKTPNADSAKKDNESFANRYDKDDQSKSYLDYDKLPDAVKNEANSSKYGRIVFKSADGKYMEYDKKTGKTSIINEKQVQEINNAAKAGHVDTYFLGDMAKIKDTVDKKQDNVGGYRIVHFKNEAELEAFAKDHGLDSAQLKNVGYVFVPTPTEKDLKAMATQAESVIKNDLTAVDKPLSYTDQNGNVFTYKVKLTNKDDKNASFSITLDDEFNYGKAGQLANTITVFKDGDTCYTVTKEAGQKTKIDKLDPKNAADKKIIDMINNPNNDNVNSDSSNEVYKGEDAAELIKAALDAGDNYFIGSDGNVYTIQNVTDETGLKEGTGFYFDSENTVTTTPTKNNGSILENTDNAGFTININDYTIKNDGNGHDLEPSGSYEGINAHHALQFTHGEHYRGEGNSSSAQVTTGIVGSDLVDGFPVLNPKGPINSSESLKYLFENSSDSDSVKHYKVSNGGLFSVDENGNYKFNSANNFASFNKKTGTITIDSKPGVVIDGKSGQFFPFADDMEAHNGSFDANSVGDTAKNLDHYFVMSMKGKYVMPEGGNVTGADGKKVPMTFTFSGDDDFWLYIDGHLALDLGGIHGIQKGTIDFATGTVTVNGKVTTLSKDLLKAGSHDMSVFYLERGNYQSNLSLQFNLQTQKYYYGTKADKSFSYDNQVQKYKLETPSTTDSYVAVQDRYGVEVVTPAPVNPGDNTPGNHGDTPTPDTPTDTPDIPGTPETPSTPNTPDEPHNPVTPNTPNIPDQPHNPSTPNIPNGPEKVVAVPDEPHNPSSQVGTPINSDVTTGEENQNPMPQPVSATNDFVNNDQSKLPQTGDQHSSLSSIVGIILLGLSVFGLLSMFKKRNIKE